MASSCADDKDFEAALRQCVKGLNLKDGSERALAPSPVGNDGALHKHLGRSNGAPLVSPCRKGNMHSEPSTSAAEKKKSSQGLINQPQGHISKQNHRRSSKGKIRIILADESNFKHLVLLNTCMGSHQTQPMLVTGPRLSPLSPPSHSSVSTWESPAEAAGAGSLSQPATPTSLLSKMHFSSQPPSPLSPKSFCCPLLDEIPSNAVCVNSSVQALPPELPPCQNPQYGTHKLVFTGGVSGPYPGSMPQLAELESYLMR